MKKKKSSKGFVTALTLVGALFIILLELSKNTVPGFILTLILIAGFVWLRVFLRNRDRYNAGMSALCWISFLVLLAAVYFVTAPPVKRVPAMEGFKVQVTEPVKVSEGTLTGVYNKDKSVKIYAGIPYAKAPVGDLRWREPQAPDKYEGIYKADRFGPMAMQKQNGPLYDSLYQIIGFHKYNFSLFDNYREPASEDCLYLNIWSPARAESKPLPVIFYVHGGSLTTGQSYYTEYRGEDLAKKGVVFVNFAYRLGVFGYYASNELAEESENGTTGNYGLLDQIAALKWVKENISAFGGDPNNITIAGESAGSSSVNALCVSPLTEGLFERAIAESSSVLAPKPYHTFRPLSNALETGLRIMREFGAKNISDLRNVPAEKLLNTKFQNSSMTVDGYAIIEEPYLTYQKGNNHEKALLNGFNAKEADAFLLSTKADADNYEELLKPISGNYAHELAALVPAGSVERDQKFIIDAGGEAKGALCHVYSAAWFTYSHYLWSNMMVKENRPVYEYYFTKSNRSLSNFHAGELPYAYGNLWRSKGVYDSSDFALSEIMQNYWVNFAKYGNPNGEGLPEWTPVTEENRQIIEFNNQISMIDDPYLPIYEILDKYQAE
ncbi:MAG: carboxylesterase family protein [Lachnospiraceae bacterium]|nr:carboxylesterase family protein [Lachnospiraceae bacterium]